MKKILFILSSLLSSVLLVSCTVDDSGGFHLTWLFWLVISLVFLFFFVIVPFNGFGENKKKVDEMLEKHGLKSEGFKPIGTYVGGHPDVNETIHYMQIYQEGKTIRFYSSMSATFAPVLKFSIDADSIKNIQIEDSSSIEKRLTVGRLMLVGVFAFAWKKKEKKELVFVVIDWNDGRFDHATTFSFEGANAMQSANTARNNLISFCR